MTISASYSWVLKRLVNKLYNIEKIFNLADKSRQFSDVINCKINSVISRILKIFGDIYDISRRYREEWRLSIFNYPFCDFRDLLLDLINLGLFWLKVWHIEKPYKGSLKLAELIALHALWVRLRTFVFDRTVDQLRSRHLCVSYRVSNFCLIGR